MGESMSRGGTTKNKKITIAIIALVVLAVLVVTVVLVMKGKAYRNIKVFELGGTSTVMREKTDVFEAYTSLKLSGGDAVETHDSSFVRMTLDDDKYIKMEEQSLVSFLDVGNDNDRKIKIGLEYGTIVTEISNPLATTESYEIVTPNSTLTVRGTLFKVFVGTDKDGVVYTDVYTYGGKVTSRRIMPDGKIIEENIEVDSGYKARIRMDEVVTIYVQDPIDEEIVIPVNPYKITNSDLIMMSDAAYNGHKLFIEPQKIKEIIEERGIDLSQYMSAHNPKKAVDGSNLPSSFTLSDEAIKVMSNSQTPDLSVWEKDTVNFSPDFEQKAKKPIVKPSETVMEVTVTKQLETKVNSNFNRLPKVDNVPKIPKNNENFKDFSKVPSDLNPPINQNLENNLTTSIPAVTTIPVTAGESVSNNQKTIATTVKNVPITTTKPETTPKKLQVFKPVVTTLPVTTTTTTTTTTTPPVTTPATTTTTPPTPVEQNLLLDDGSIVIEDDGYTQGSNAKVTYSGKKYIISQNNPSVGVNATISVIGGDKDILLNNTFIANSAGTSFNVNSGAKANILEGSKVKMESQGKGLNVDGSNSTFNATGTDIDMTTNLGGVYVSADGNLTLSGGTTNITTTSADMSSIRVLSAGTVDIKNGANINISSEGYGITVEETGSIFATTGSNIKINSKSRGILCEDLSSVVINGGKLDITNAEYGINISGAGSTFNATGTDINMTTNLGGVYVSADGNLTLSGGTATIITEGNGSGIYATGNGVVNIKDGANIDITGQGITAGGTGTINTIDANININANAKNGIYINPQGSVNIKGGTTNITSTVDGVKITGADANLNFTGANININSTNNGVFVQDNGEITINGGTTKIETQVTDGAGIYAILGSKVNFLNNATIEIDSLDNGIYIEELGSIFTSTYANITIHCNANGISAVTNGEVTLSGGKTDITAVNIGIFSGGTVYLLNEIEVICNSEKGFYCNSSKIINVTNANVNISASKHGIGGYGIVTVNGGTTTIIGTGGSGKGIYVTSGTTNFLNGAKLNITSQSDAGISITGNTGVFTGTNSDITIHNAFMGVIANNGGSFILSGGTANITATVSTSSKGITTNSKTIFKDGAKVISNSTGGGVITIEDGVYADLGRIDSTSSIKSSDNTTIYPLRLTGCPSSMAGMEVYIGESPTDKISYTFQNSPSDSGEYVVWLPAGQYHVSNGAQTTAPFTLSDYTTPTVSFMTVFSNLLSDVIELPMLPDNKLIEPDIPNIPAIDTVPNDPTAPDINDKSNNENIIPNEPIIPDIDRETSENDSIITNPENNTDIENNDLIPDQEALKEKNLINSNSSDTNNIENNTSTNADLIGDSFNSDSDITMDSPLISAA